jgi:hypothetical protein
VELPPLTMSPQAPVFPTTEPCERIAGLAAVELDEGRSRIALPHLAPAIDRHGVGHGRPGVRHIREKIQGFRYRRANDDQAARAHGWRGNPTDEIQEVLDVCCRPRRSARDDRRCDDLVADMERQRRPPCKGALQQPGATPLGQPQTTVA